MFFATGLRRLVGGAESVELEARDVRELLSALEVRYPGITAAIGEDCSIAIDGEILPRVEAHLECLRPESEVHFLAQISGG